MTLNFSSGQQYDFMLREGVKPDGKIVWQWAKGHMFAQMMSARKLEPGKSLTFTETLPAKPTASRADPSKPEPTRSRQRWRLLGERPSTTTQVVIK